MIRRRAGFTIVELLIVIVVIAILAAIIIVAYNGVQQRAADATIDEAVTTWVKALTATKEVNGSYPTISGDFVCLSSSLPADGAYSANQCAYDDSGWSATVNSAFNTTVSSAIGNLPQTVLPKVDGNYGGGYDHFRGILYYDTINGNAENGILYDVNGTNCGAGGVTYYTYQSGNTQCKYVLQ